MPRCDKSPYSRRKEILHNLDILLSDRKSAIRSRLIVELDQVLKDQLTPTISARLDK